MDNIKQKLFDFRKDLTLEQSEIAYVIDAHMRSVGEVTEMGTTGSMSEIELLESIKGHLKPYEFYDNVKGLLESVNAEEPTVVDELKDLYFKIERSSNLLYRQPLTVLFEIMNMEDNVNMHYRIMNELALYDWVPEIKQFLWKMSTKPQDRANYSQNGGRADTVFGVYANVSEGRIVYVADRWFALKESEITSTTLEEHFKDDTERRRLLLLEEAVKIATLSDDSIDFTLDENLILGIRTKSGKIFLNDSEVEAGTTLESLFSSHIVPFMHRGHYAVIGEAAQNLKKFVDVDVVKKVTNVLNPYVECYAFNHKDSVYLYRVDKRYGNTLYKYENASALIAEVKKELDYDLTFFYENKVSTEVKELKRLEDREFKIKEALEEVQNALFNISTEVELLKESSDARKLELKLLSRKHQLVEESKKIRARKNDLLGANGGK